MRFSLYFNAVKACVVKLSTVECGSRDCSLKKFKDIMKEKKEEENKIYITEEFKAILNDTGMLSTSHSSKEILYLEDIFVTLEVEIETPA